MKEAAKRRTARLYALGLWALTYARWLGAERMSWLAIGFLSIRLQRRSELGCTMQRFREPLVF